MADLEKTLLKYMSRCEDVTIRTRKAIENLAKSLSEGVLSAIASYSLSLLEEQKDTFSFNNLPDNLKQSITEWENEFANQAFVEMLNGGRNTDLLSREMNKALGYLDSVNDDYFYLQNGAEYESMDVYEYMTRVIDGKSLREEINTNTKRFLVVIESFFLIELVRTKQDDSVNPSDVIRKVSNHIWSNIASPFTSAIITEAVSKNLLKPTVGHYGRGYDSNGIGQIMKISDAKLFSVFHQSNYLTWSKMIGFLGFYSLVTSSNPCQFCIDQQFKLMKNPPVLPYHLNCLCILVPVFI